MRNLSGIFAIAKTALRFLAPPVVRRFFFLLTAISCLLLPFRGPLAQAASFTPHFMQTALKAVRNAAQPDATTVPAAGTISMAFSPNAGAEELVIKVIDTTPQGDSLSVMAYSFTNPRITQALLRAKKDRNVEIQLIADHNHNLGPSSDSKARAALSALDNAGIEVYTTTEFAIHHDKVIMNTNTLQTGSYNYSSAATSRNSENVLVMWNNPAAVRVYRKHFERNLQGAMRFHAR